MNKRYFASAIITGALLATGSAFAAGAPSDNPNDSSAAPLNKPTTQGATAPAPAGSNSTMGGGKSMTHGGTHSSKSHSGKMDTTKSGTMNSNTNHSGSNMQPGSTNRGNAAQPSQPRPVTGG